MKYLNTTNQGNRRWKPPKKISVPYVSAGSSGCGRNAYIIKPHKRSVACHACGLYHETEK